MNITFGTQVYRCEICGVFPIDPIFHHLQLYRENLRLYDYQFTICMFCSVGFAIIL